MLEPSLEVEQAARKIQPAPLRLEPVAGGLFNEVVRATSAEGTSYLKRFADQATSGTFPPLPTSAAERCRVAAAWHALANWASEAAPSVAVPELLWVDSNTNLIAMREVAGTPLHAQLVSGDSGRSDVLQLLIAWLAALHGGNLQPRDDLIAASAPFKRFKIDLQYRKVLADVPSDLHPAAERFIDAYLEIGSDPVHGDLNSRNVLVSAGSLAVIDFEQGHFGEGTYDLAYLLCEFTILWLRAGMEPEGVLEPIWRQYAAARGWNYGGPEFTRWRIHLGFQTLYRLVGPSRQVWTGHLDAQAQAAVRQWSVDELHRWLG